MFDKELPMIPSKRLPITLAGGGKEACQDNSTCCETEKTLARLYGDQSIAKERCIHICTQAKKIEEEDLAAEIKVFKALSDVTRLKIFKLLTGGELSICEIMLALKKPQSSISHNLSILEDAGLIRERKQGKWCLYEISDKAAVDMTNLAKQFRKK